MQGLTKKQIEGKLASCGSIVEKLEQWDAILKTLGYTYPDFNIDQYNKIFGESFASGTSIPQSLFEKHFQKDWHTVDARLSRIRLGAKANYVILKHVRNFKIKYTSGNKAPFLEELRLIEQKETDAIQALKHKGIDAYNPGELHHNYQNVLIQLIAEYKGTDFLGDFPHILTENEYFTPACDNTLKAVYAEHILYKAALKHTIEEIELKEQAQKYLQELDINTLEHSPRVYDYYRRNVTFRGIKFDKISCAFMPQHVLELIEDEERKGCRFNFQEYVKGFIEQYKEGFNCKTESLKFEIFSAVQLPLTSYCTPKISFIHTKQGKQRYFNNEEVYKYGKRMAKMYLAWQEIINNLPVYEHRFYGEEEPQNTDNETPKEILSKTKNAGNESQLSDTIAEKVKFHFDFFNGNCPRKHKKILEDEDFNKLIKWTIEYFENEFKEPEILEPIKAVNTNKTFVQLAFKYLFKELHKSSPYPKTLFEFYKRAFIPYSDDKPKNFESVKNNDEVKKLMKIDY